MAGCLGCHALQGSDRLEIRVVEVVSKDAMAKGHYAQASRPRIDRISDKNEGRLMDLTRRFLGGRFGEDSGAHDAMRFHFAAGAS